MHSETKHRIITALDAAFRTAGADGLEQGMTLCSKLFEALYRITEPLKSRDAIEAFLDHMQEPSAEEETLLVASVEMLPVLVRMAVQDIADDMSKALPHPPGGRPRALSPEDHKEVCEFVGRLHTQGVALREAKKRAARKWSVSAVTVERAWRMRGQPVEKRFEAKELMRYLQS